MGSKKLKRKKLKIKKLQKFRKLKLIKRERDVMLESLKETNFQSENTTNNRLSEKKCSRSLFQGKDIFDVKHFSKVREEYFRYLQRVVSDNCVFWCSVVTVEMLENLALELEQVALLACLQVDIYKKSMINIIKDIKKCTQEKQIHQDVKKLLPESLTENITATVIPNEESYSKIPIIASIRTDDTPMIDTNHWAESNFNSDPYFPVSDQTFEAHMDMNSHNWIENETYLEAADNLNYWATEESQTGKSNIIGNFETVSPNKFAAIPNNFNNSNISLNWSEENHRIVDPLLISQHQLEKAVELTLNETEKINKQKQDEKEKAYIAQILEGNDSLDERLNDSLSDNENDCNETPDETNLTDRLEKMRELFGMEEECQIETALEKQKPSNKVNHISTHSKKPTIWRYEKFIQLHKYSKIAAEMTFDRRQINQRIFLDLFGEDSDEEHEAEYMSTDKFRSSCTERISSWVVKYLMPFYHDKRILGRSIFKSLGHYVSDAIVDKIQYPDEWTVKYLVSKFFPPKKKYVCDADILNFQLD